MAGERMAGGRHTPERAANARRAARRGRGGVLNPLRSEGDAFRVVLYAIAVVGVLLVLGLILRALV